MTKKSTGIILLLLIADFLFVQMTCGRRHCSNPETAQLTPYDNADSTPHAPGAAGVKATAFMLELNINFSDYICKRRTSLFVSQAYAGPAYYTPIDHVELTSDRNFDATHPAGSDLQDLFNHPNVSALNFYTPKTNFYLLHPPSDSGTHIFTIKIYTIDSGRTIITTAAPVKLTL